MCLIFVSLLPLSQKGAIYAKIEQVRQQIFLTFQEAQEFLGVSQQRLYKLMNEGLPSDKIGDK